MKKRAFDEDESVEPAVLAERTEPTPRGRTAIALVLASWVLPLGLLGAIFTYSEDDPSVHIVNRVLTLASLALLVAAMALAVRAMDVARRNPNVRRRLAIAALLLSALTPIVWVAEVALAFRVYVVRERLDAAEDAAHDDAASSPAAE